MKIVTNLGVAKESQLKHPTACFRLSQWVTRVSDALAFGEFYSKNVKGVLKAQDLEHVSASMYTSGNSAKMLATLVGDGELKNAVEAYSKAALSFNSSLRNRIPNVAAKAKAKPLKPISANLLKKKTQDLRSELAAIEKKVESLCTVNQPARAVKSPSRPVASKAMHGRVTMAGPIKKPIYPRYFVASMGRSRI